MEENQRVLEALERLAVSLKELPANEDPTKLSHWRELPEAVETAYKVMQEGAELVKATSTKYTLVGKINVEQGSKLAKDLLKGCELVATGALVICQENVGCSRSARHYVKQAARSIVATTIELLKVFVSGQALEEESPQVGAQKTGVVWSSCDALLKLPKGNRASMRRDLFTYIMECNETMQEFTQIMELGPALTEEEPDEQQQDDDDISTSFDDFLAGDSNDQYTSAEIPIAEASLALIKCSRGSVNVVLKACEAVGEHYAVGNNEDGLLEWIGRLHNLARRVGEHMTDLGTCLYPPLNLTTANDDNDDECLIRQLELQTTCILELHEFVLDARPNNVQVWELPEDVTELSSKLRQAVQIRHQEATDAISAALETTTTR